MEEVDIKESLHSRFSQASTEEQDECRANRGRGSAQSEEGMKELDVRRSLIRKNLFGIWIMMERVRSSQWKRSKVHFRVDCYDAGRPPPYKIHSLRLPRPLKRPNFSVLALTRPHEVSESEQRKEGLEDCPQADAYVELGGKGGGIAPPP